MNMFWNNVKSELEYQGISIKELASKTGLQAQSIYNSISKNTLPTLDAAYKIAQAVNQPLEYLINGDIFEPNNLNLPTRELKLLDNYGKLSLKEKHAVDLLVESLVEDIKTDNKDDIF